MVCLAASEAPTGLSEISADTTSENFTVTWDADSHGTVTGWKLLYRDVDAAADAPWTELPQPADQTHATVLLNNTGADAGKTFHVKLVAVSGDVESDPSDAIQVSLSEFVFHFFVFCCWQQNLGVHFFVQIAISAAFALVLC